MRRYKTPDNKTFVYDVQVTKGLPIPNLISFTHDGAEWDSRTRQGIVLIANLPFRTVVYGDVGIYLARHNIQATTDSETRFFLVSSDRIGESKFKFKVGCASVQPHDLFEKFQKEADDKWQLLHNKNTIKELMYERVEEIERLAGGNARVTKVDISGIMWFGVSIVKVDFAGYDGPTSPKEIEDIRAVERAVEEKKERLCLRNC